MPEEINADPTTGDPRMNCPKCGQKCSHFFSDPMPLNHWQCDNCGWGKPPPKTPPAPPTCQRCGWPLHDDPKDGCTADNCSQRPLPPLKDEVEKQRRVPTKKEIFDAVEAELMKAFNRQDGAVVVDLMRQLRALLTR